MHFIVWRILNKFNQVNLTAHALQPALKQRYSNKTLRHTWVCRHCAASVYYPVKEVMFFGCLSVCISVCLWTRHLKTSGRIRLQLCMQVSFLPKRNWLTFGNSQTYSSQWKIIPRRRSYSLSGGLHSDRFLPQAPTRIRRWPRWETQSPLQCVAKKKC